MLVMTVVVTMEMRMMMMMLVMLVMLVVGPPRFTQSSDWCSGRVLETLGRRRTA